MKFNASKKVGIIAEDISDVLSARVMIHRIAGNDKIGVEKFFGKGCGKVKRKCFKWAEILKRKECCVLILIHDRDDCSVSSLLEELQQAIRPCPINNYLICIPVQELEAWILGDPDAIKLGMNLRLTPKVKGMPENINSPKEYLGNVVRKASGGEKLYVNTKHNEMIVRHLNFLKVSARCPSFTPFLEFVKLHFGNN